MRWTWIAGAVALFLVFAAVVGWLPLGAGPRCLTDDAIEPAVRAKAQAFSRAFFAAVLRRDGEAAYAMLTPGYRKQTSQDDFNAALTALAEGGGGAFAKLAPRAAYEVSRGSQPGRVFCGNSETGVTVNALPGAPQIHTLYAAETPAHKWALNAWLVPAGETWTVASFYVSIASVGAHDAQALQKLATVQAGKGHAFNAYMLMSAASATAYRGPDFQPVAKPRIDAALAAMKVPAELTGNPPRTWKMGAKSYSVEQVTIVGAPDQALGLVIQYRDAAWDLTDPDGEVRNRALIEAFAKKHPGWRESFGFLVARILRPGENMGWGTVFDAKAGFAEAAAVARPN
ncbi:MAG: hypothetical protein ACKVRO_05340 [Micropepsaceae bacterium]